jgi:small subunit ribosomal protein S3Ae
MPTIAFLTSTPPPSCFRAQAVGKNKRLTKGKKGQKKQKFDVFTKKEWYDIRTPSYFNVRKAGITPITRTIGTKIASEEMMGRVFEVCLADLQKDEDQAYRKIKLIAEDIQGKNVLTNFHGMDMTRDKLCSLIKKWQSLIEAAADVRTTDGYYLRMFAIGFTKKRQNQLKKTCFAKASQKRAIRQKMIEIMTEEAGKCELKEIVAKFIPEVLGKEIEKACQGIFPLQNCFIRKVKITKKPRFDITKLMEVHGDTGVEEVGASLTTDREEGETALEGAGGRL